MHAACNQRSFLSEFIFAAGRKKSYAFILFTPK